VYKVDKVFAPEDFGEWSPIPMHLKKARARSPVLI
jgi:hypothetical protein